MHTGDMGRIDAAGFLHIVDRKKDMVRTGGENVYAREVEQLLITHPEIVEAAGGRFYPMQIMEKWSLRLSSRETAVFLMSKK